MAPADVAAAPQNTHASQCWLRDAMQRPVSIAEAVAAPSLLRKARDVSTEKVEAEIKLHINMPTSKKFMHFERISLDISNFPIMLSIPSQLSIFGERRIPSIVLLSV